MPAYLVRLCSTLCLFVGCTSIAAAQVFINEIHYDNASTDVGEAIEIAGPAGMDVSGWSIVLYNGSSGVVYDTDVLSGTFVDQQGGVGTMVVIYPTNGIQNGAPDGIALVDESDAVVQFLSYEGTFMAVGGPANGLMSTDIGVEEGSGVSIGDSLQLTGCGLSAADFTWAAAQANTFGAVNTGQLFDANPPDPCPGPDPDPDPDPGGDPSLITLVINEIDYDQDGTDNAEFLEIKNIGALGVDLTGVSVQLVNGSSGAVYRIFDLPSETLGVGEYFVICGDAANTPNCDIDSSTNTNLIQNGAPDAATIVFDSTVIDAVSYEGSVAGAVEGSGAGLTDDPSIDFASIARFPDGVDTGQNNIDLSQRCTTPGETNSANTADCPDPVPPPLPVGPFEIFEIQGTGSASPFEDLAVITEGNVVTALAADGFTMQTPDSRDDMNIDTSNGIFVFTGGAPTVTVGDLVNVTGEIDEFFGFTEFTNLQDLMVIGTDALPTPVTFDAATPSPDPTTPSCAIEYECYEGMRVQITDGSVTGPNQRFGSDPVAEVHITAASTRTFREKGIDFPGLPGLPVWDGNPEVFELDPDRVGLPNQIIPAGSSFSATGVIGFDFGGYELWPTSLTVTEATLPRAVRGKRWFETTVGSLNLFRLFDDIDDPEGVGPFGLPTDDSVVSTEEYQRRLNKFADYVVNSMRSPDIIGVQEVESQKVLEDLAAAINALHPWAFYEAHVVEGNDIGTIDVGFLVRKWRVWFVSVEQLGAVETYINPNDNLPDLLHDRPPLLLKGWTGFVRLNVMVVHNRSLNGIDTPRVQAKRLAQAESIAQKVQGIQSARHAPSLVVVGDFNAFEFTDGFVDAIGHIRGDFDPTESVLSGADLVEPDLLDQLLSLPPEERYSFIFRGNAQTLDHALTSSSLDLRVRGLQYARGNADAAVDLINDDSTVLRASDHDGFVLYIYKGWIRRRHRH